MSDTLGFWYKNYICLSLQPDRTWHKVNDPKSASSGG